MSNMIKNIVERLAYYVDAIKVKGDDIHIESVCVNDGFIGVFYRVGKMPIIHEMELGKFEGSLMPFLSEKDKCLICKLHGINNVLTGLVLSKKISEMERGRIVGEELKNEGF